MISQLFNFLVLLIIVGCQASGGGGGDVVNHVQTTAKFGLSTPLNKTYAINEDIPFTVSFPYEMTITGSPELSLIIGGTSRIASYVSGDGLKDVTFKYTVQAGDNDLDGIIVSPNINLNGGTCFYQTTKSCPTTLTVPALTSVLVDTVSPVLNSVSGPIPSTYYANQILVFTATFSEAVNVSGTPRIPVIIGSSTRFANYASGSGTSTLIFSYQVTTTDSDLDGVAVASSIDLNSGTIKDGSNLSSTLNFSAPNTSLVIVAGANPIVTSITPPLNATYGSAQNLDFTLTFNKVVNVTGSPRLTLTIGSATRYANYLSGSGSTNIKFRYTVAGGDLDNDGISLSNQISMNGGSIKDSSSNDAALILITPNLSGVKVLTTAPSIISVTIPVAPATGFNTSQNVDFTVNLSEAMTESTGTSRLKLDVGGATAYANYLSGSGTSAFIYRYSVALNHEDLNGLDIIPALELNGSTISNAASVPLTLTFIPPVTTSLKIDAKAPVLSSNSKPANGTYTTGQNLDFDVTYHEAVLVTGTPRIALDIGGVTKYANYFSGTGSSTLKFRYVVTALDTDTDGISITSTIDLNSGSIKDGNNHLAGLTLTSTVTSGVLVDTSAPLITSVTAPASGTYLTGQNLDFTVNWNENVLVTGTPRLALVIGSTTKYATYVSGSASTALLFRYTVASGDVDSDGISVNSPVDLNSGTIKDAAGLNGALTFTSPSTSGIIVGATTPTIISVTPPSNGKYTAGQNVDFSVTFSEPVVVTLQPSIAINLESSTVYATYLSGGGTNTLLFRYTVAANDFDSDGITLVSPIQKNSGNIQNVSLSFDAILNYTIPATAGIIIDGIDPIITSVTGPAAATYILGQNLDFDVTYSSSVVVSGTPKLLITIGSSNKTADYVSGSGSSVLKFRYTVVNNDQDNDGVATVSPLLLNSGTIKDSFSDDVSLTFTGSTLTGVNVDAAAPSIASITPPADGTYDAGNTLNFTVNFSENVIITGVPRIELVIGSTTRYANYVSGSGTSSAIFSYILNGSDTDTDGIGIVSPLSLNGGSIADTATNNLSSLTFTPPVTSILVSGNVAVAANSSITGSGPVIADGTATSTVTITLKNASNNPVSGVVPTFGATDTGTTNVYGACSASDSSGISLCTMSSLKAESKTLSILTPVSKAGTNVLFTNGPAVASNSAITATGPVIANGVATSTVTISLKDLANNPVSGEVPLFTATDTGATNVYGSCSSSNASGVSTCSLTSLRAEVKTLSISSPVTKIGGTVTFTAGVPVAANSSITGSGPVFADGTSTSTVTITLKDINNNPVSAQVPTFSATDTGSTNVMGTCSSSDSSGVSTCSLKSLTAEVKTLSIATPVVKTGGTVTFTAGNAVAANSTISGTGPVIANGTATSTITITLKDASNNPVSGQVPTFSATDTGSGNTYGTCSATNASGISTCTFKSTKAEVKTLSIVTPVVKTGTTVTFTAGVAVAANSTVTGTGPVVANDVATSTVTITLKDANNNFVSGTVPTFTATNTSSTNTYGTCSSSDASGISTCTLKSRKAETKTLSIATPFVKSGGTVVFTPGLPDSASSDIAGTSPVSADGVSVSFITITIGDAFGNPISGVTPIFNATDANGTNAYGACSATNSTGVSSCTLSSTKAEAKTLQLTSPVAVTGSTPVTFSSTLPTAANSSITGTSPVVADGATDSTVSITLRDSGNNPVSGITPTFDATDTGSTNAYDDCSMSDASGVAICTMTSTKAEIKTLRITNPVTKTGGTVTFTPGPAAATASTISGTGPVMANGTSTSTITILIKDAFSNPISGTTPTFTATNTGSGNTQTACSVTDATGTSTCTLKSTKAETKIPQIVTPVTKSGTGIVFTAGSAVAANSTITGTSPVNPDGSSTSTITITLKDANNNNVSGIVPTFAATGTNNTLGTCSSSASTGISTCTLASTTAETKTLSISTPVTKTGGTVVFQSGSAVAANSSITGTTNITANGIATSTVTITLKDSANAPVVSIVPTFTASGTNNTYNTCSATNASGVSTCTMTSLRAEGKTLEISSPVIKAGSTIAFIPGPASATTTTIEASDPNLADGVTPATITITVLDAYNNAISGVTPTYSLSGTGNTLGACSVTDSSGSSTCEVTSTKAEGKTVALLTPVAVTGNIVDFNPNGIDIQVPIEMIDRGLASSTSAINFTRSMTSFNPDDYVSAGNKYFFEIVADNTNTSITYNIQIIDSTATVITDSTIAIPPSTSLKRFRVEWTPNSGADVYRIRVPATATASQVKVHSAKIIVEQDNAVASKIYIPLMGGDVTGESNVDTTASVASTTTTSFTQPTASNFNLWTRTDTSYDAIAAGTPWTLDTVMSISNAAGTVSAALYDKTNNQQITAATTTQTGSTGVVLKSVSFASNAPNFDNGDTIELRMKSSSTSYTARVFKAGIWLKLKYLKKAEVYYRLSNRRSSSSSGAVIDGRYLWEAGAWSNPTVYFQTNASVATSSVVLMSHNTNDNGSTSPTTVTSITPTATYSIQRSAALSLTNNFRYWVQHNRSGGTVILGGAFLVIRSTE